MNNDGFTEESLNANKPTEIGLSVCEHITAMISYWDRNLICRFANKACAEWHGRSRDEMIGKATLAEILGPELYEKDLPHINAVLNGEKQVFERDLPLLCGGFRHSLISFSPDIVSNKVRGFIIHVADISYIKKLEEKLLQSRREMLRNIFETQENERANIVHILRDSVNQALVYCKIVLNERIKKGIDTEFNQNLNKSVGDAIDELNSLCISLVPSSIEYFGFIAGTSDYIENYQVKHPCATNFDCRGNDIEQLSLNDKLSLFRIIQDYLEMIREAPAENDIGISVIFENPVLHIQLTHSAVKFEYDKMSIEYKDIEERVEYYGGTLREESSQTQKKMHIIIKIQ